MIFWDTSALVPLLVDEPETSRIEALAREDGDLLVWWGTRVEIASALARREREGGLSPDAADAARTLLDALASAWSEVQASETVRAHALRLLRRHPRRAADALQLAAALTWARGRPEGHRFCTLDERQAGAARREGFARAP